MLGTHCLARYVTLALNVCHDIVHGASVLGYAEPTTQSCGSFGDHANCVSFQVTALPLCGGITSPLAIGAVVDGESCDCQTPLSGHFSPVLAVVPTAAMTFLQKQPRRLRGKCEVMFRRLEGVTLEIAGMSQYEKRVFWVRLELSRSHVYGGEGNPAKSASIWR